MPNADGERKARQEFRKKLREWGMCEKDLEKCVKEYKTNQEKKRLGLIPIDAEMCTRPVYLQMRHRHLVPKVPCGVDGMIQDGRLLGNSVAILRRKSVGEQLKALGVPGRMRSRIHQRMCVHDSRRAQYGVLYFMMGWFYERG